MKEISLCFCDEGKRAYFLLYSACDDYWTIRNEIGETMTVSHRELFQAIDSVFNLRGMNVL